MTTDQLLDRLDHVRQSRDGWIARCPAHKDRSPSLSIHEGERGILLHCFAGCSIESICAALEILVSSLFWKKASREPTPFSCAARDAWFLHDEIIGLRSYYADALHRAESIEARTHDWHTLGRLAPVSRFFLAAFVHLNRLPTTGLVRFALMTPAERRFAILGG